MDSSSEEDFAPSGRSFVPRRLAAYRAALNRTVEEARVAAAPISQDKIAWMEGQLLELIGIVRKCDDADSDGWKEMLTLFKELEVRAREHRTIEQIFSKTSVIDDDSILDKAGLNYSSFSTVPETGGPIDDIATFFSSGSRRDDPNAGCYSTGEGYGHDDALEITTTLKSFEHRVVRYLSTQLNIATEVVRTQTSLHDCSEKSRGLPADAKDSIIDLVDRSGRIINTELWPALQTTAYNAAIPLKKWSWRLEILADVFGQIVTASSGDDREAELEKTVREIRNDLHYLVNDALCESCLIIPASYQTRCCHRGVCQRCVSIMIRAPPVARRGPAWTQCLCCRKYNKVYHSIKVNPLTTKISKLLLYRLTNS